MTEYLQSRRTQRYLAVVARASAIAFFVFGLTTYVGISITDNFLTKTYLAKASMGITPRLPSMIATGPSDQPSTDFQAEFQIIESPEVLQPVITELNLDKVWAGRIFRTSEPLYEEQTLKYLVKNLRLNFKHGSNIVEVIATSDDPKEAADIANGIADHYKKLRDDEEAEHFLRAQQALSEQVAQQQKLVEGSKAELQRLDNSLMARGHGSLESRLKELEDAKANVAASDAFLKEMASQSDDQLFHAPATIFEPDPDAAKLRTDILKKEEEITNLLSGSEPDNAGLAALQNDLALKKAQLNIIVQAVQRKMKADLDAAKSHLVLLQKEVDETEKLNPEGIKAYRNGLRDLDQQQALLVALMQQQNERSAATSQITSPVRILARAEVPTTPSQPNTRLCYAITYALAGLLSIMIPCSVEVIFLISRAAEDTNRELLPVR